MPMGLEVGKCRPTEAVGTLIPGPGIAVRRCSPVESEDAAEPCSRRQEPAQPERGHHGKTTD